MEGLLIIGYILAIFIGISMGLMGSGGSILTLPIFVYLFQIEPQYAVDYSLFTIGCIALIGSIKPIINHEIHFKRIIYFLIPSLISVFFSKRYILPLIPKEFLIGTIQFSRNHVILFLFSIVILISAIAMLKNNVTNSKPQEKKLDGYHCLKMIVTGILVGILTGMVGAGGGFIIVPAFVLLLGMRLKEAISSSLFIIALNSNVGLISNYHLFDHIDWAVLLRFTAITLTGLLLGSYLKNKLDAGKLKTLFSYFLMVIGTLIFITELFQIIHL